MRSISPSGCVILACIYLALPAEAASPAADSRPTLAVLDIEILGDLGDASLAPGQQARRRMASARLREELSRSGLYEIADNSQARELIEQLAAVQYLHKCNGCELDIGMALEAQEVLVAWVNRMSNLVLTLNYEIRDVHSGQPVTGGAFDFRGDNDQAWTRAVNYLVKDLRSRRARAPVGTQFR